MTNPSFLLVIFIDVLFLNKISTKAIFKRATATKYCYNIAQSLSVITVERNNTSYKKVIQNKPMIAVKIMSKNAFYATCCVASVIALPMSVWANTPTKPTDVAKYAYDTGFVYDKTYAMNFDECPQHFVDNQPPKFGRGDNFELCYKAFAILYSPKSKTALYVAEHLTADTIKQARQLPRQDSFRAEPRLPDDIKANLSDYKSSGYDRGHLAPNGNMADVQSQADSFSLANIIPQNRDHNRKVWADIESHVRDLTVKYGQSYVVTGTAHHGNQVVSLNGVIVPTHLYKAVYIPNQNISAVYYTPNDQHLDYEIIDLATLQERIGIDPFGKAAELGKMGDFRQDIFVLDNHAPKEQTLSLVQYLKKLGLELVKLLQK